MTISKSDAQRSGVLRPALTQASDEPFGPARIAHWSSVAEFELLGTYLMVFDTHGEADAWTLSYEESIYVISGEAWIVEIAGEHERTITVAAGELVVIRKGTTVRYGGTANTRLLLSIAPVDWDVDS